MVCCPDIDIELLYVLQLCCCTMYAKLYHDVRPVFFDLFIGVKSFGTCRFLAEPHAVTRELVLFQVDRDISFLYVVMLEKTPIDYSVYTSVGL